MVKKKNFFYLFYSYDESFKLDPNDSVVWKSKDNAFYDLK